jgi:DNA-binding NtrC family response regulator
VPITIPPLRERQEDIPLLADHFLKRFSQRKTLDETAVAALLRYSWPGNVRELEAAIERTAVFSRNTTIGLSDLPSEISKFPLQASDTPWDIPEGGIIFEDLERDLLAKALTKAQGNMSHAAKLLGMSYRTFRYRANAFGLRGE